MSKQFDTLEMLVRAVANRNSSGFKEIEALAEERGVSFGEALCEHLGIEVPE